MLFSNIFKTKKTVTINLAENVRLTVTPATAGGVYATLSETGEFFNRTEKAYFITLRDLVKSLRLTDDRIIKKLSKAF